MFIDITDMPSTMYGYQIEQITEGDDSIVLQALAAAEEEVRSYLTANQRKEFFDGRFVYDADTILSATGSARNPLILEVTKTIAKWWIVQLSNADIIYEQAKERYDRAVAWLKQLADGSVNLSTLPTIDLSLDTEKQPFSFGSRAKFKHDY